MVFDTFQVYRSTVTNKRVKWNPVFGGNKLLAIDKSFPFFLPDSEPIRVRTLGAGINIFNHESGDLIFAINNDEISEIQCYETGKKKPLLFSPDGKIIITKSRGNMVFRNSQNGEVISKKYIYSYDKKLEKSKIRFSNKSAKIFCFLNNLFWSLDIETSEIKEIEIPNGSWHISPDERILAGITKSNQISLWDIQNRKEFAQISSPRRTSDWPYFTIRDYKKDRAFDIPPSNIDDFESIKPCPISHFSKISFSPDGSLLLAMGGDVYYGEETYSASKINRVITSWNLRDTRKMNIYALPDRHGRLLNIGKDFFFGNHDNVVAINRRKGFDFWNPLENQNVLEINFDEFEPWRGKSTSQINVIDFNSDDDLFAFTMRSSLGFISIRTGEMFGSGGKIEMRVDDIGFLQDNLFYLYGRGSGETGLIMLHYER